MKGVEVKIINKLCAQPYIIPKKNVERKSTNALTGFKFFVCFYHQKPISKKYKKKITLCVDAERIL